MFLTNRYDPKRSLFEQFAGKQPGLDDPMMPVSGHFRLISDAKVQRVQDGEVPSAESSGLMSQEQIGASSPESNPDASADERSIPIPGSKDGNAPHDSGNRQEDSDQSRSANSVLFSQSLFEGSPAYKQRRKKASRERRLRRQRAGTATSSYDTGEEESGSDAEEAFRQGIPFSMDSHAVPYQHTGPPHGSAPPFYDVRQDGLSFSDQSPIISGGMLRPRQINFDAPQSYSSHAGSPGPWPLMARPESSHDQHSMHDNRFSPFDTPAMQHESSSLAAAQMNAVAPSVVGSKGFHCPLISCGRLFKRLEHLKRHVRTHTQERPYECTRCSKRFSRSDNLTQHIKTHEKADRGERLKTEASSESTEEEMTYLEAEVDAMAAREGMPFGKIDTVKSTAKQAFRYSVEGDPGANSKLELSQRADRNRWLDELFRRRKGDFQHSDTWCNSSCEHRRPSFLPRSVRHGRLELDSGSTWIIGHYSSCIEQTAPIFDAKSSDFHPQPEWVLRSDTVSSLCSSAKVSSLFVHLGIIKQSVNRSSTSFGESKGIFIGPWHASTTSYALL